jgi:hypothetical protein
MDQMGEVDYVPGEPKVTPLGSHRGLETVTYMINGSGEAADDLVVFGDQFHELHVDIGELARNGAIQRLAAPASSGAYSSSITSRWPPLKTSSTSRRTVALLCSDTVAPRHQGQPA